MQECLRHSYCCVIGGGTYEMSDLYVARLVQYGIESGLIPEEERIYSTNQILEVMKKDDYEAPTAEEVGTEIDLADTLVESYPEICLIQS